MTRDDISSINLIETILAIEETFEVEIPDGDTEALAGPREIVDWLAARLTDKPIGDRAALLLQNLAKQQGAPELASHLHGNWRREQIVAVVQEILRLYALEGWSEPADPDALANAPGKS